MEMRHDPAQGVWWFSDDHGALWCVRPTKDRNYPLKIEMVERCASGQEARELAARMIGRDCGY